VTIECGAPFEAQGKEEWLCPLEIFDVFDEGHAEEV
jgi:hypothetical protein